MYVLYAEPFLSFPLLYFPVSSDGIVELSQCFHHLHHFSCCLLIFKKKVCQNQVASVWQTLHVQPAWTKGEFLWDDPGQRSLSHYLVSNQKGLGISRFIMG